MKKVLFTAAASLVFGAVGFGMPAAAQKIPGMGDMPASKEDIAIWKLMTPAQQQATCKAAGWKWKSNSLTNSCERSGKTCFPVLDLYWKGWTLSSQKQNCKVCGGTFSKKWSGNKCKLNN